MTQTMAKRADKNKIADDLGIAINVANVDGRANDSGINIDKGIRNNNK